MIIHLESINNIYNVGLYIRLSREDDDKAYESESITNQKSLLLQYAKENNLRIYDIYIDDGFSGTNFDRPGFKRLIKDIELKKINMVITKDMSRLGRDYIGTGELVEKYFPEHNVRYIAVTDNIDTYLDSTNNDIAPFKAIMNDFYAKDISKKIKSSLKAKMKDGKYVGGRAPFGYTKDPDNKNQLVIDEEQAIIVRRIFEMALNGLTYYKIADILTNEGIKTPAAYYEFEWCGNYNPNFNKWNSKTIHDILNNRVYTGDLVQGRRCKVNYKVKKIVKNNPNNYIVVENTHEAIVDKDVFYEVQKKLPKNVGRKEKKENNLLDGLLYCGDCGHRISVQARRKRDNKHYTLCNYYRAYMKEHLCTAHSNNYDKLEEEILNTLREVCLKYLDKNKVKDSVINNCNNKDNNKEKEIEILSKDINQLNENLDNIYIDKLNKVITEDQFNRVKNKLVLELDRKMSRFNELKNDTLDEINEDKIHKKIENYINKFLSMKNPSRELVSSLIDRIDIFEDKRIHIKFSFKNEI